MIILWMIWNTYRAQFFAAIPIVLTLQRLFVWPHRARLDPVCESTGSRRCVGGGALLVLPVDVKLVLVQIQMGWHSLVLNGWCHSVRNSALMQQWEVDHCATELQWVLAPSYQGCSVESELPSEPGVNMMMIFLVVNIVVTVKFEKF